MIYQFPSLHRDVEPTLNELLDEVKTTKWYRLGLELGVDDYSLAVIQEDTRNSTEKGREEMLKRWLESCERPTWRAVVQGLSVVGDKKLAAKLQDKFLK